MELILEKTKSFYDTVKYVIIESLAGCGKTTLLVKVANKTKEVGQNILYLAFNKDIRKEVIDRGFNVNEIHTFHSLAYNDLKGNGLLNSVFEKCKIDIGDCSFEDLVLPEKKHNVFFEELLKVWLKNYKKSSFTTIDALFIDELQDLDSTMFKIIQKLYELNKHRGISVFAAGDYYQSIYNHLRKKKVDGSSYKNFKKFEKMFPDVQKISLETSYRCSPSILNFTNGFYKKQYSEDRYFNISEGSEIGDDVIIHSLQHKNLAYPMVMRLLSDYRDKEVVILGRVNEELEEYRWLEDDKENISVSTIHKYKGCEADIAIVINTQNNDKLLTEEDKNVWNVGITRAKEKLHIVSSFPEEVICSLFEDGTYLLDSNQIKYEEADIDIIPEEEIRITQKKLIKSIIDSVEVSFRTENVPFVPYEKPDVEKYKTSISLMNMDFVLHKVNKHLIFKFNDLNQLKNQSFNDVEIYNYVKEVIRTYFHYQIDDSAIANSSVRRLDLAQYHEVVSKEQAIEDIKTLFSLSKYNNADDKVLVKSDDLGNSTVYLNAANTKNRKLRVLRAYFPSGKPNQNKLVDNDNLLKMEISWYRDPSSISNKSSLQMNFGDLGETIRRDKLNDLYMGWLKNEFPYIDKPLKNIELMMKRRDISSREDFCRYIDSREISRKEKRVLFLIWLDLMYSREEKSQGEEKIGNNMPIYYSSSFLTEAGVFSLNLHKDEQEELTAEYERSLEQQDDIDNVA